jgi:ribosomal protein S14
MRDRELRFAFFRNELYILAFKFLIYNQLLRLGTLYLFNLMNLNFFHDFLSKYAKSRIINYCIQSGRARGVFSFFRLSRLSFRELAVQGLLAGVHRALW